MPISTMREAAGLTAGTLATMALEQDQAYRRAMRAGEWDDALEHKRERNRLCELSRKCGIAPDNLVTPLSEVTSEEDQ